MPDYISTKGGIRTLSRFIVRALGDCFPTADILVLSKNDDTTGPSEGDPASRFATVGCWPLMLRTFAFSVLLGRCACVERPDLIITTHVHFAPVAHFLFRFLHIPYIAVGNGVEVWTIRKQSVRNALRSATKLLAISELTRQRMGKTIGVAPEDIELFPCTFDSGEFQPAAKPPLLLKRYGLRSEQPVILTVARLVANERFKGYDQILQAIPAIIQQIPDVRYIIAGKGSDKPRIEALVRDLQLEPYVIFTDYVPTHEMCAHYNLCDAFAMPSKQEGFGIVFLEAIACGKPVVAGNKDGSVDAVLGGRIGALVDPDDVHEIEETLIQILTKTHPTAILRDSARLRARVIEAYGYEQFAKRLRDILIPIVGWGGDNGNSYGI